MNVKEQKNMFVRGSFGFGLIIIGLLLNAFGVTGVAFQEMGGVGGWLIMVGFISLMITVLQKLRGKKKQVDERVEFIAARASRIVFLALIIAAFVIMVIDALVAITLPYYLFMAYLISGVVLVYVLAYKQLEKTY